MATKTKTSAAKKIEKKAAAPAAKPTVSKAPAVMELCAPMTAGFDLYCELDAGGGDILRLEHNGKRFVVRKAKTTGEAGNADFQVAGWSFIGETERMGDGLRMFAAELDRIDGIEPASATPSNLTRMVETTLAQMNGKPVATQQRVEAPAQPEAPQPGDPVWPAGVSFRDDAFRHDRRLLHVRQLCAWLLHTFPAFMVRINRTVAVERNLCVVEMAREPKGDRATDWKSAIFVRREIPTVMVMSAAITDDQDITKKGPFQKVLRAVSYQFQEPCSVPEHAGLTASPTGEQPLVKPAATAEAPDFSEYEDGAASMKPGDVADALRDAEKDGQLEPFARWLASLRPDLRDAISTHLSEAASGISLEAAPLPPAKATPPLPAQAPAKPTPTTPPTKPGETIALPFEQVMELAGGDAAAVWQAIEIATGTKATGYSKLPTDQKAKVVEQLRKRAEAKAQGVGVEAPPVAPAAVVVAAKAAAKAKPAKAARK